MTACYVQKTIKKEIIMFLFREKSVVQNNSDEHLKLMDELIDRGYHRAMSGDAERKNRAKNLDFI